MWGCDLCRTSRVLPWLNLHTEGQKLQRHQAKYTLARICTLNSRLWANLRLWQHLQNPFPMCLRTENGKSCTHKPHLPQTFLHLPVAILMLGNKRTSLPMVVDSWGLHLLTPPNRPNRPNLFLAPQTPSLQGSPSDPRFLKAVHLYLPSTHGDWRELAGMRTVMRWSQGGIRNCDNLTSTARNPGTCFEPAILGSSFILDCLHDFQPSPNPSPAVLWPNCMSRHDHKSSDLLELPGHANSLPPKRPGLGGGSAGMVGWTAGDGLLTSKITKGGVQCFVCVWIWLLWDVEKQRSCYKDLPWKRNCVEKTEHLAVDHFVYESGMSGLLFSGYPTGLVPSDAYDRCLFQRIKPILAWPQVKDINNEMISGRILEVDDPFEDWEECGFMHGTR